MTCPVRSDSIMSACVRGVCAGAVRVGKGARALDGQVIVIVTAIATVTCKSNSNGNSGSNSQRKSFEQEGTTPPLSARAG